MRLWSYTGICCASLSALSTAFPAGKDTDASELQTLSRQLPPCALQCVETLAPQSNCRSSNLTCLCTDPTYNEAAKTCLLSACSVRDVLIATRLQKTACGFPTRDNSGITRGVEWTLFSVAVMAVVLRLLARANMLGGEGLWWDDWTILLCLALLIPLNTLLARMLDLGLGKDIWMLKPQGITNVLFYFWVEEFVYVAIVLLTKVSILLLYLRLFPETERWFRLACFALIGILLLTFVPIYSVVVWQCHPVDYAWLKWDGTHSGFCINTVAQIIAFSGINIIFDLTVFLLPIPRLLQLNVSTTKKTAVLSVFLVGLFITICSIVRLQFLLQWGTSTNPTWQYNPLAIWSSVECNLGVACACMPTLSGPFKRLWHKTIGSRSSPSDSTLRVRHRSSSSLFGHGHNNCEDVLGSKMVPIRLSQRRLDSTDEVELVGRNSNPNLT